MFASGRKDDLNVQVGAFQHMLADALVAAGVVAAGADSILLHPLAVRIDPVVSLVVSGPHRLGHLGHY